MVRDGDRTVLSLMNDYQGEPSEFALVVPVPVVLQTGADPYRRSRDCSSSIDATARRAWSSITIRIRVRMPMIGDGAADDWQGVRPQRLLPAARRRSAKALGVTVEAQYTVGEYDIVILSATQSDGLETWLQRKRLQDSAQALARARALHPPGDEVLRREGQPQRASGAPGSAICGRSSSPSSRRSSCCRFGSG